MKNDLNARLFLIVDDNLDEMQYLCKLVTSLDGKWRMARDLVSAKRILDEEPIDCLITDLHLDQELLDGRIPAGVELLSYARKNQPTVLLMATSGDPRLETYHAAAKAGALAYLSKPVKNTDVFRIAYFEALTKRFESRLDVPIDLPNYLSEIRQRFPSDIVISTEARKILGGVAKYPENTLILTGETGTGKEHMAKFVYEERIAMEGPIPFIAVNCATIDPSLATSLLFGHKKGSFSGAGETTRGFIGDADGGILFLDEIHYLDLTCQQKLLRVLNDGHYERLGDTKTLRSTFQLITASTKDLKDEVKQEKFLLDLYMRLMGGIELQLMPLKDRPHEIPALVGIFLLHQKLDLTELEFRTLCKKLQSYDWPGNIRQLFKMLQSWVATAQCQDRKPSVDFLPFIHHQKKSVSVEKNASLATDLTLLDAKQIEAIDILIDALQNNRNFEQSMDAIEKNIIRSALMRNNSIGDTASALGLSRSTLDSKRRKYSIEK